MKKILEMIKDGFDIALEALLLFVFRIGACLYFVGLPLAITTFISSLIPLILILCEIEHALIFKILFSLFQIIALLISMLWVSYDGEASKNDYSSQYIPSKDLIVAVYVIINLYVWGILKV